MMYDAVADQWTYGPEAPFNSSHIRSAAISDTEIMVVGAGTSFTECYIYDIEAETFTAAADIPEGRLGGTLVSDGEVLWYFGGWDGTSTVRDEVMAYVIASDYWYTSAYMPEPRLGLTGVLGSDGLVYLMGGSTTIMWYGANTDECLAFDTYTGTFIDLPDLPETVRYGAAFELDDGRIMFFGGHNESVGRDGVLTLKAWDLEVSLSSDSVGQGGSVWLSISLRTEFAPMDEMYGDVFMTAMGVTYAWYGLYSMGDMAYLELPISENVVPLGYVIEVANLGYNYKQHFEVEAMPLTVTAAPSTDDRLDDLEAQNDALQDKLDDLEQQNQDLADQLDDAKAELKEATDAKLDAMIGYVILILVIVTLVVGVIVLVRKK